jgi:Spy/CpxP family protein refolding chaperone
LGLSIAGGALAAGFGNHHGCGGAHGFWRSAQHSPEQLQERADFAAEWVLRYVNASTEQEAQIKTIIETAISELTPMKTQHEEHRQAFLNALQQPQVERAALQQIRADELALAETVSSRIVDVIADLATVLTPEQRAELGKLVQRFQDRH